MVEREKCRLLGYLSAWRHDKRESADGLCRNFLAGYSSGRRWQYLFFDIEASGHHD